MSIWSSPTQAKQAANYGNAADWASIIAGAGQGAGSYLQSASALAASKKEAKEAKRRTLANLVNQALKRQQQMERIQEEFQHESAYDKANALQEMARGFVQSLQGSTGHRVY